MAFHLLRHKHRFHLNPSLVCIFSTSSSSCTKFQPPPSNFLTKKPLAESSGDAFDRFTLRPHFREEEIQNRVETEQLMVEKPRRVGRPKVERNQNDNNVNSLPDTTLKTWNLLREQKPIEEKHWRYFSPRPDSSDSILRKLREKDEETQSIVGKTEKPKEQKRRRAGRPRNQVLEEKPIDETQSRVARLSGTRRRKVTASKSAHFTLKNHPDYLCSVTHAMHALNNLSRVKKWSPFYCASMDNVMADVAHRQAFLTFLIPMT